MKKIVIAIDSFKGCLTSAEANRAAAEGLLRAMPSAEVVQVPVSDGGEGWLEAFHRARGGLTVEARVCDPLRRPVAAPYLVQTASLQLPGGEHRPPMTAVIEMAKASGLMLLAPEERNPLVATTYGTGQLIADAVERGCKHIVVGLGGSATSDCGMGMLRALVDTYAAAGHWDDITALRGVRFTIATDVTNPLCGENGAAHVFAPQKGATPAMVAALDARARHFAAVSARHFGFDRSGTPGAGAAGGLGYAFLQYMNADCRPGIDILLDAAGFDSILHDASFVITGEGTADRQTLMGKLPFGILQRAKRHHVPVVLMAGRVSDRERLLGAGFSHVECINPPGLLAQEAMKPETARENIRKTASRLQGI